VNIGDRIWVPCEVKPGQFPNERLVLLTPAPGDEWLAFVEAQELREPKEEGATWVIASITDIIDNELLVYVQGHAVGSSQVRVPAAKVQLVDSVTP